MLYKCGNISNNVLETPNEPRTGFDLNFGFNLDLSTHTQKENKVQYLIWFGQYYIGVNKKNQSAQNPPKQWKFTYEKPTQNKNHN